MWFGVCNATTSHHISRDLALHGISCHKQRLIRLLAKLASKHFTGFLFFVSREVLHGVGADGVGVKFPILAVNCSCSPLSSEKREENSRNGKVPPTPSAATPLRTSQVRIGKWSCIRHCTTKASDDRMRLSKC